MTAPRSETRLDLRTILMGLGALLLLVSLFLDWYGDREGDDAISAWQSFELVDLLLAVLAVAALYEFVRRLAGDRSWPAAPELARFAGPAALLLVVVSLIDDPPLAALAEAEREVGIWLALAGALLMTLGTFLGRVRITLETAPRDRPQATTAAPPHDPDTRTRPLP